MKIWVFITGTFETDEEQGKKEKNYSISFKIINGKARCVESVRKVNLEHYLKWNFCLKNELKIVFENQNAAHVKFRTDFCEVKMTEYKESLDEDSEGFNKGERDKLLQHIFKAFESQIKNIVICYRPVESRLFDVFENTSNRRLSSLQAFCFVVRESGRLYVAYQIDDEAETNKCVERIYKQLEWCTFPVCCKTMFENTDLQKQFKDKFRKVQITWFEDGDYAVADIDGPDSEKAVECLSNELSNCIEQTVSDIDNVGDIEDVPLAIIKFMELYRDKCTVYWNIFKNEKRIAICTDGKVHATAIWSKLKKGFKKMLVPTLSSKSSDYKSLEKTLQHKFRFVQMENKEPPSFLLCLRSDEMQIQEELSHTTDKIILKNAFTFGFVVEEIETLMAKFNVEITGCKDNHKFILSGPADRVQKCLDCIRYIEDSIHQANICLQAREMPDKNEIDTCCVQNKVILNDVVIEIDPHTVEHASLQFQTGNEVCVAKMNARQCRADLVVQTKVSDDEGLFTVFY